MFRCYLSCLSKNRLYVGVFLKIDFIGSPGQAAFSGGREAYGEGPGIEEQPIKNYISANKDSEVLDKSFYTEALQSVDRIQNLDRKRIVFGPTNFENLCWFLNFYNAIKIVVVFTVFPVVKGKIYCRNNIYWRYTNYFRGPRKFGAFIRLNLCFLSARGPQF